MRSRRKCRAICLVSGCGEFKPVVFAEVRVMINGVELTEEAVIEMRPRSSPQSSDDHE